MILLHLNHSNTVVESKLKLHAIMEFKTKLIFSSLYNIGSRSRIRSSIKTLKYLICRIRCLLWKGEREKKCQHSFSRSRWKKEYKTSGPRGGQGEVWMTGVFLVLHTRKPSQGCQVQKIKKPKFGQILKNEKRPNG